MAAAPQRLRAAHRRVDAVAPRLVVRGRDDTAAVRVATDDQRLRAGSGRSSSSTAAKNASRSTWATITVEEKSHIRHRRDTHLSQVRRYRRSMAAKAATTSTKTTSTKTTSTRTSTRARKPRRRGRQATIVDEVALPQRRRRASPHSCSYSRTRGERRSLRRHRGHGSARTRDAACARPRKLHDALRNHPELAETLVRGGL